MTQANSESTTSDEGRREFGQIYWLGIVVVLAVVVGTPWFIWGFRWLAPESAEQGQFGDQFGMTNALFSGLAFFGVVVAILLQREELQLQRRELRDTRATLGEQRDEFARQVSLMKQQNALSLFFQLLDRLEYSRNLVHVGPGGFRHGRFELMAGAAQGLHAFRQIVQAFEHENVSAAEWLAVYVNSIHGASLEQFIRVVLAILELIDEVGQPESSRLAGILRANMHRDEIRAVAAVAEHTEGELAQRLIYRRHVWEICAGAALDVD